MRSRELSLWCETSGRDTDCSFTSCLEQDRLVRCLQMCVTQFVRREERGAEERAEPDGLPEPVEEAREVLESLVGRMADTHLDDFELVCI